MGADTDERIERLTTVEVQMAEVSKDVGALTADVRLLVSAMDQLRGGVRMLAGAVAFGGFVATVAGVTVAIVALRH